MCSTITPDLRYDNIIAKFIGRFTVRKKCVRGNFVCTKNFFNLWEEAAINVLKARPRVRCGISSLKKKHRVSWKCDQGFYFSEETQKSVQYFIGDAFCHEKYCSRQKSVGVHTWKRTIKNVTNEFNAKRAATFWKFLLRTQIR